MCGVIGYIGKKNASEILLTGLRRMEYRGYDSAGISTHETTGVKTSKKSGAVQKLEQVLQTSPHKGTVGIGHTRWATHGSPTDTNAHPHTSGKITLIHNGIIENYKEIKQLLITKGYNFISETDTEVFAALIDFHYSESHDAKKAVELAIDQVRGTFGSCILFADQPKLLIVTRRSSPILIAQDGEDIYIASDQYALAGQATTAVVLNDNEIAICTPGKIDIIATTESSESQQVLEITSNEDEIGKDGFDHFMQKEIHEQPDAVRRTLQGRLYQQYGTAQLGGIHMSAQQLRSVTSLMFVGCGTAYNAGLTAKYLLEPILGMPISVEVASELRYRNMSLGGNELAIAISQSGETADTLACVEELKLKGIPVLGVVNVVGSTISREVDSGTYMHAGPEISVASTKAFTSQVVALLLIGLLMARQRNMTLSAGQSMISSLDHLPDQISHVLSLEDNIAKLAPKFAKLPHLMVLGRDTLYPIAIETALKIKEITYIPTTGYPAGEMKHGPIALLGDHMGVLYYLPKGDLYEKSLSNLAEVQARNAQVIVVTDDSDYKGKNVIHLPESDNIQQPILFSVVGQLFAYHLAKTLGREIDKPRNLAKSVTVE